MPDVRYALRLVMRQPGFACLIVGTLMLGIGASTSMFSVINSVLLKPLPYENPATLVWMFGAFRLNESASVSPPDFIDYRDRNNAFVKLGAMSIAPMDVTVTGSGGPSRLKASRVSAELITTLGVRPILGRDFTRGDETNASSAILVSHRLWQERFGGAGNVLGQSIVVDGRPRTIVGVLPAGFTLPYDSFIRLTDPVDFYVPIAFDDPEAQVRRFHYLRVIGRLESAGALRQAQSQMDVIARQLAAIYPENDTWHLRLVPLHEQIVGAVRPALVVLMAAVILLLLVSCGNVASLLLARASVRDTELALRGALGASRARIVRQLLIEGFVLSFAGGAAGLILTWWTIQLLKRVGPARFPRLHSIALEPRVIAFALAAAAVTTLIFALAPAIHASRGDLAAAIGPGRGATRDASRRLGQRVLVVGQLCMSVVLLAGAALLVRGFVQLVSIDTGFTPGGVMLTALPLPPDRYATPQKTEAFYSAFLEQLAASPGIEAAALGSGPPMVGANDSAVYREGRPPASPSDRRFAQIRWIQGDYFRTLGIPLVSGRLFDDRLDRAGAPEVVVINRRMARDYFGDEDPVGQHLVIDLGQMITSTVIGVTGDVRMFGQANEAPAMVYLHARQHPFSYMRVIVKSAAAPADVVSAIRRHLRDLDPTLAVANIDRMETLLADSVAQPRFSMLLIGSFAAFALLLTLVGLYGTVAYLVSQRRREIGIRLAVGATRRDIRRLVLRQGGALIAAGVPLGLFVSLFTSRIASTVFLEVKGGNPILLVAVGLLVALAALLAVLVPAIRATHIDPARTLTAQ